METPVPIPGVASITADARLMGFASRQGSQGQFHFPAQAVFDLITVDLLWALGISAAVSDSKTVTSNTTFSIPAGWAIDNIYFVNTTANAVTGGIRVGTSSGASDVVVTIAVGANAITDLSQSLDTLPLKRLFSTGSAQTLFVQAVTGWNSASVRVAILRHRIF